MSQPPEASTTAPVPLDLDALNQKLDVLSVQVGYLIERAQADARRQQERAELIDDVVPIANQAIGIVTEQLDEIQEYIDLCDILRLVKRLLRSGRNIDRMLDQLESLMDLAQTVGPLATSVFEKVTDQLETAEQRGYFALAKGGARALDKVATSLTPEDVDRLADNLVVLVGAFKELDEPVESSTRSLFKQMRDPDVRRGLAVMMRMLRAIGAEAATEQRAATAAKSDTEK
jgi:uncharacterized protein YjgD (DUF1641 family)